MTEKTIDYKELAESYVAAIKDGDLEKLQEIPQSLSSDEEKHLGLTAIVEKIEAESDEFKEDNKQLVLALSDTLKALNVLKDEADSSEAATEDTEAEAEVEKAVEPDTSAEGEK